MKLCVYAQCIDEKAIAIDISYFYSYKIKLLQAWRAQNKKKLNLPPQMLLKTKCKLYSNKSNA